MHKHTVHTAYIVLIIIAVIGFIAWYLLAPIRTPTLSVPQPTQFSIYSQATSTILTNMSQADDDRISLQCRTRLYEHGQKQQKVIVLLHGLTNCPQQFEQLGIDLFNRGYNVYIPRFPYHGYSDRMSTNLSKLTAQEIVNLTSISIDYAKALGDQVVVMGLSLGGVATSWAGQTRSDVNHAIVLAPNFAYVEYSNFENAIMRTGLWLPNQFWWWDDNLKERIPGPQYAYPRYSTRAVAESFKLGWQVRQLAKTQSYNAQMITIVTNQNDEAVNNTVIEELLASWSRSGKAANQYVFDQELSLGHDLIDPLQPYANTQAVYPKLIELVENHYQSD